MGCVSYYMIYNGSYMILNVVGIYVGVRLKCFRLNVLISFSV